MDANDIKFDFATLIIDDNDKIDKEILQKQKAAEMKLDPFMRSFLSRNADKPTNSATASQGHFNKRNRSV